MTPELALRVAVNERGSPGDRSPGRSDHPCPMMHRSACVHPVRPRTWTTERSLPPVRAGR